MERAGSRFKSLRWTPLLAVAVWLGCGGSQSLEISAGCSTTFEVGGFWNTTFRCENSTCVTGMDRIELTQNPSERTQVSGEIVSPTLPGDFAVSFAGQLCGNVFSWTSTDPDSDESGAWTFSDEENFTERSSLERGELTCVGTGTREPLPVPEPFACPVP